MLEATNLSKTYGTYKAVDNLNLKIVPGEIFCLLGQNGAGKTTTVNLFLGFLKADGGKATINGKDAFLESGSSRKELAYIPENVLLYPHLSGEENLEFFSRLCGFRYSRDEIKQFLQKAGLQTDAHAKRISGYSKGMRQKVGIAIAVAKKAKVLLLDEPTSGLDPQASNEFSEILKEQARDGVAILMTTHDIFRAKEISKRVGIMKRGTLLKTIDSSSIGHNELEKLYLDTIQD